MWFVKCLFTFWGWLFFTKCRYYRPLNRYELAGTEYEFKPKIYGYGNSLIGTGIREFDVVFFPRNAFLTLASDTSRSVLEGQLTDPGASPDTQCSPDGWSRHLRPPAWSVESIRQDNGDFMPDWSATDARQSACVKSLALGVMWFRRVTFFCAKTGHRRTSPGSALRATLWPAKNK